MPVSRSADLRFIDETLRLARKARGRTDPNPMVGAVIVKGGKIVGQGYHHRAGLPHAEIEAFNSTDTDIAGATLYVNLEPCSHFGRTPPCADAIIRAGIRRVVCCTLDPNPQVNGRGVAKLRKGGIKVRIGLRAKEARELNAEFFGRYEKKPPRTQRSRQKSPGSELGSGAGRQNQRSGQV